MSYTTSIKNIGSILLTALVIGISPSGVKAQSCASSSQIPMTTTRFRQITDGYQITNSSMDYLTKNRTVGRAFQELVQRSMKYPKENGYNFTSPARFAATGNSRQYVRPDFTEPVRQYLGRTRGYRTDSHGSFVEVKAVGSPLTLGYYGYQILGHIDAVSRRPAQGYGPGAARVLFITTSNTTVGSDTLARATRENVAIWQAIVCRDSGQNSFQVGSAVPLNTAVYAGRSIPVPLFPGVKTNVWYRTSTPPSAYEDTNGGY